MQVFDVAVQLAFASMERSSLYPKKRKSRCVLTWCGIDCGANNWLPSKYVYDAETYGIVLLKVNGFTTERKIGEASGGHRAQL